MSSTFAAEPGSSDFATRSPNAGPWRRGRGCGGSWTPAELLAMILGFMVYWPIGLAILGWKMVQRRGLPVEDLLGAWRTSFSGGAMPFGRDGAWGRTGNSAFDAWRAAEIERLDAERRKLEEAQREFATFAEEARRARDKEEFERFMSRHRG